MNAQELFRRYARVFNDDKELMYMTESQFVAALAEAIEGGHLQPVFCQPGEAGSKGGPQNAGVVDFIRGLLVAKEQEYKALANNAAMHGKSEQQIAWQHSRMVCTDMLDEINKYWG